MEKILEYQKLDSELFRLQRDINKNDSKKEAQNLVSVVKDAQSHIIELENNAKNICSEIEKLSQVQSKGISLVEKYSKQLSKDAQNPELIEMMAKVKQTSRQLNELENRLLSIEQKTKQILQEFDSTKKKANIARTKHIEAKTKFNEYYETRLPEINEIKQKLQTLEKEIDSPIISKYKSMKQDGIFPIIVPIIDNRCSGCRMELASGEIVKLKEKGKLECPSCHRIIYIKN